MTPITRMILVSDKTLVDHNFWTKRKFVSRGNTCRCFYKTKQWVAYWIILTGRCLVQTRSRVRQDSSCSLLHGSQSEPPMTLGISACHSLVLEADWVVPSFAYDTIQHHWRILWSTNRMCFTKILTKCNINHNTYHKECCGSHCMWEI